MLNRQVIVSRCLGFEACRYNGGKVESPEIDELRNIMELITVCPEVDVGLGVPRSPINLVKHGDQVKVIQMGTRRDLTESLFDYTDATLTNLRDMDAFILKAGSPSCGLGSAKFWDREGLKIVELGSGVFACEAQKRFPNSVFLDEEELSKMGVRGFLELLRI
jgi:uncharacterized protein YbbK (DUF523 family)